MPCRSMLRSWMPTASPRGGGARAAALHGIAVVKELEAWLGAQLLQRTTRKLSVTAEGRRYYEECKRLLAEMAAMEASFPGRSLSPPGGSR